ncbi:N-acetylmuramoyl-L-alanine amidase isoform X2 [Hyla sarda]|nr:N-acetylmuramoyl-L-alanine amidase isoform X2 [Hyla sarda]XP_056426795.1 N-acetylmuramoyl-L-alanine amidase isoform X2 [Hyla sarda]XP_056426796.1 N-acetylmuramoyl-L-alanine amidase isoform X2 [Hyla sarda]XP_056426797.1 N-acetylmuramoyl-L-alanine amidase isoform X2 [Hyla sarda]
MVSWYLIFFLPLCMSSDPQNGHVMNMDTFIGLIKELESTQPDSSHKDLVQLLFSAIAPPFSSPEGLSAQQVSLTKALLIHKVVAIKDDVWQEQGVVLAPDGTTVAVSPLLGALLWGWKVDCKWENAQVKSPDGKDHCPSSLSPNNDGRPRTLFAMSLASAFADPEVSLDAPLDFPNGCWDSISLPKTFQLQGAIVRNDLTLAYINGALDGALLKGMLSNETQNMSSLLQSYYRGQPAKSAFRRQNFQGLLKEGQLAEEIHKGINCYREFAGCHDLQPITEELLISIASEAAKKFEQQYLECPAVIPRCLWEAKPYKGTPTLLKPPLAHVYIHHTYEPSRPCVSFQDCSADMRSMQRFHQVDRGWDDIGYSFVVGSDGYLYEGRGWHWVGAHTKGHNFVGYGISFIGDFTSSVPESHILQLVRDRFLKCAVTSGYILPNYTIQGHRQVVKTTCPGDALFQEITSWEHFTKESKD